MLASFHRKLFAAGLLVAVSMPGAHAQLYPRSFNNPPGKPLRACSCDDIEALQDYLETAEYGIREFENFAKDRRKLEAAPGGPPHITLNEYNALYNSLGSVGPEVRHPLPGASTKTSDNSCKIYDADLRIAAPCQEIYDGYRRHEELHQATCKKSWSTAGKTPFDFQSGSDVLQEEADGYKISAGVYRKALEALLEKAKFRLKFKQDSSEPESRFDSEFVVTLAAAPFMPPDDGKVEWLGNDSMKFSDIVHFEGNRYRGCSGPDVAREDVIKAVTRDFRTIEFSHQPKPNAVATLSCKRGGSTKLPLPSMLAARWRQYLIPTSKLEMSSFNGLRDFIGSVTSAPLPPGVTAPPGFGTGGALPPSVAAQIAALSGGSQFPPRTTYPWPPLIGSVDPSGAMIVTRYKSRTLTPLNSGPQTADTDRPEIYVDDFGQRPAVSIITGLELICRP